MTELREFAQRAGDWLHEGKQVLAATVIETWGSSPRRPGAMLFFTDDLQMIGSVTAGCVEGAVIEEGRTLLKKNQRAKLLHYGVSDDTAWEVGLACGGELDVLVQTWTSEEQAAIQPLLESEATFIRAVVIGGAEDLLGATLIAHDGKVTHSTLPPIIAEDLAGSLRDWTDATAVIQQEGGLRFFVQCISPPDTLVIVGGNHVAVALARLADVLDYRVVLIDPRSAFASEERFPQVQQVLNEWPQNALPKLNLSPATSVVLLTHDPKVDDPALEVVLRSQAGYIGALGSRRTQAARRERLLERGLTEAEIARIHGPVGLDIGAKSPAEIALSILAEMVQVRAGR
ncbi:MAG: XdhC family protein [Anaerolineae bacterium]|nr:XdhC family protein [Anaerolineae bacterium]